MLRFVGTFLLAIIFIIVVIIMVSCIRIVRQAQAMVIERLGTYQATWNTGFHMKWPIFDRVAKKIDRRSGARPDADIERDDQYENEGLS